MIPKSRNNPNSQAAGSRKQKFPLRSLMTRNCRRTILKRIVPCPRRTQAYRRATRNRHLRPTERIGRFFFSPLRSDRPTTALRIKLLNINSLYVAVRIYALGTSRCSFLL